MTSAQSLVEAALEATRSSACVVLIDEGTEVHLRWAGNELIGSGTAGTRTITLITIECSPNFGCRVGVIAGTAETLDEMRELVTVADAAARNGPMSTDAEPLVEPYSHADDWPAEVPTTSLDAFDDTIAALSASFRRWRPSGRALFGFAEHRMTTTFLGTSTGLRRRFDQPDGRLELTGRSADDTGTAWTGHYLPQPSGATVDAALDKLERRLAIRGNRRELQPGRYETILPPSVVADLLVYAYGALDARDADEGRSAFAGREGQALCDRPLTLSSDPRYSGLVCPPFEIATGTSPRQSVLDNGQPVSATRWVDEGRLRELVRTRAWARRMGRSARPLVGNLVLDGGGTATVDDMVASTERGLLLTSLWYVRGVDPSTLLVTGLTRDGVYLVEDGRIVAPVNNFRFNESPVDLLARVSEVGRTERALPRERADAFRRTAMPPLRIADFRMSTVSSAQ